MLSLALSFFDKLLEKLFLDAAASKITNALDVRNVQRKIAQTAEIPAQTLDGFFRKEGLEEGQITAVLDAVQQAITNAGVSAAMLASTSLNAEKLTTMILDKYRIPTSLQKEGLDWPYRMALKMATEALCHIGPRFADWEQAAWRRSFDAFDTLLANTEQILQTVGTDVEGAADERFAHTYRTHVVRRLGTIDVSTLRVSSSLALDLNMVFVQPDVMESPSLPNDLEADIEALEQTLSVEEAREMVMKAFQVQTERERRPADAFISEHQRCAIVGLPGSGKTTLFQHLLLDIAKGELSFGSLAQPIPVLVRVRELNQKRLPGIDELLQVTESSVFSGARPGFLPRQFEAGHVVLLIDGMDEIVDEQRDALYQWIEDIVMGYPHARYVISSRPAGYRAEEFQRLGFHECTLCEFNDDQIRDYVYRWTTAVAMAEGANLEEAEAESAQSAAMLVERAEQNPYVRRIATNPLLLSTLCIVQRHDGGNLPNRRVVLYQRCVEGLLFHWDHKRGLPPEILGSLPLERKMLLLRQLALAMQVQGIAEMDEPRVAQVFQTALDKVGHAAEIQQILDNIRDRSGLLVERRPGIYGFSHLTFQEYLAACAVHQADNATYDRLFLFSKREDPQWAEVIALYAGLATRDAVECFMAELLETGPDETVLLCGECLASAQDVSITLRHAILRKIFSMPDALTRQQQKRMEQLLTGVDDGSVVKCMAIEALDDMRKGHAMRYLAGSRDAEVLEAYEAALVRELQREVTWCTYGTLALSRLIVDPSELAADILTRLRESARRSAYGTLGTYFAHTLSPEPDANDYGDVGFAPMGLRPEVTGILLGHGWPSRPEARWQTKREEYGMALVQLTWQTDRAPTRQDESRGRRRQAVLHLQYAGLRPDDWMTWAWPLCEYDGQVEIYVDAQVTTKINRSSRTA